MNVINTIDLAQELQAETSFTQKDAVGIVKAIAKAIDATTSNLVTRDQFDARFAELEARLAELRAELKTDIAELRAEVRAEVPGLRGEMATLRGEMRTEIANLRSEVHQAIRAQTVWMTGTMVALAALIVAALKLL